MQCVRLKRDHAAPRMCHCGKRTGPPNTAGIYTIQVGRLAWLCTDNKCNNTHEAHQQNGNYSNNGNDNDKDETNNLVVKAGQPLGIPCNAVGKVYRLHLHSLFDELHLQRYVASKSAAYNWLALQLNLSRSNSHVARFGISTCRRAIIACQVALSASQLIAAGQACGLIALYLQ